MKEEQTTFGDRLQGGAFFGALGAAAMAGTFAVYQGAMKLMSKTAKFRFDKTQWKVVGGAAAISSVLGFLSANTAQEKKTEAAYLAAAAELNDPNNNASQAEKEKKFNATVEKLMDGKLPDQSESTKFRDMVSKEALQASRGK